MIKTIERLAKSLAPDTGALVVSHKNIMYLTGYDREECYLAIAGGRALVTTDFRYADLLETCIEGSGVERFIGGVADQLAAISSFFHACDVREIRVEEDKVTLAEKKAFASALPDQRFAFLGGAIERMRAVKTEREIAAILKAQQIAEKAYRTLLGEVREGVTERQLAISLEHHMRLFGADDPSFASIVASGVNSACPHAVPGERKLQKGDLVTFDFGACYQGYCSDTTRTVSIGRPSDEQRKIYDIVGEAHQAGILALKAGMSGGDADKVCRDIIAKAGFAEAFGHSTGHGVGLDIHEYPRLGANSTQELLENMVVTVEPGIYLKERFGVRTEDILVVRHSHAEDLTSLSSHLEIL